MMDGSVRTIAMDVSPAAWPLLDPAGGETLSWTTKLPDRGGARSWPVRGSDLGTARTLRGLSFGSAERLRAFGGCWRSLGRAPVCFPTLLAHRRS